MPTNTYATFKELSYKEEKKKPKITLKQIFNNIRIKLKKNKKKKK
tara:strand:- start:1569 stop:1703 length:135 start_codon:yes stop_codon:yes gene_type:complete